MGFAIGASFSNAISRVVWLAKGKAFHPSVLKAKNNLSLTVIPTKNAEFTKLKAYLPDSKQVAILEYDTATYGHPFIYDLKLTDLAFADKGIGSKLLDDFIVRMRQRGSTKISLQPIPSPVEGKYIITQEALEGFYYSKGFRKVPNRTDNRWTLQL